MSECIFCKIANGEIPNEDFIYEDRDFVAFLDFKPINPGHILVIPKKHYENLFVMPDELVTRYILLIKKLAPKVKEALNARWVNLLVFGEEVKHTHIHIVPRLDNDNFQYPKQKEYEEGEMKKITKKIKSALNLFFD